MKFVRYGFSPSPAAASASAALSLVNRGEGKGEGVLSKAGDNNDEHKFWT